MKNFLSFKYLVIVLGLSFPYASFGQVIFGSYADTIPLPFHCSGLEFIEEDIWIVVDKRLRQLSFPEMEALNDYIIPDGLFPISDITSDGSKYIWLGEGRGAAGGFLHTFDIENETFISKVKLTGIDDYQIQGLEYHEDELWITNWKHEESMTTILRASTEGAVMEEFDMDKGALVPISIKNDFLFTANKDFLFAFEINIMGLFDFHVFPVGNFVSGISDIKGGKLWFAFQTPNTTLYSIILRPFITSTSDQGEPELSIYPNPSVDYISVSSALDLSAYEGVILDNLGRACLSSITDLSKINISTLIPQDYILMLHAEGLPPYAIRFAKQ